MDDTSVSCSPALWRISKTFLKESEKLLSLVWAWVEGLNECVFSGSRLTMNDRVSVWMSVVYFGRWWQEGGWIFCRHGDRRGWHLKFISYTSSAAVDSLEAQVSMCLCALWWICLNLRANRGNVFVITGSTWWETLRGHQVIDKFCALLCFPFGGGERFKQVFCVLKTAINMAGCWKTALF